MKEKITTITREYDSNGNLIKETEVITEKEYQDNIIPLSPTIVPYIPYSPIYVDKPYYSPIVTCSTGTTKVGD